VNIIERFAAKRGIGFSLAWLYKRYFEQWRTLLFK